MCSKGRLVLCRHFLSLLITKNSSFHSLIHTDKSNLEYIAAKFYQQIQFFSLKMQKSGGLVIFPRSGTLVVLPCLPLRQLTSNAQRDTTRGLQSHLTVLVDESNTVVLVVPRLFPRRICRLLQATPRPIVLPTGLGMGLLRLHTGVVTRPLHLQRARRVEAGIIILVPPDHLLFPLPRHMAIVEANPVHSLQLHLEDPHYYLYQGLPLHRPSIGVSHRISLPLKAFSSRTLSW